MPIWLIEFFGARDLDFAFYLILLMTLPVWVGMIAFPESRRVRQLAQPWLLTPAYSLVLFVLLYKSYESSLLPDPLLRVSYDDARQLARHPVAFLALFCNLQILNLFVGTMIYQKATRCGFRAPVELALCWLFGAVALAPFLLRLLLRRDRLT